MTGLTLNPWRLAAAVALMFTLQTAWAQADFSLARAQELVEARQAPAAYKMLAPHSDRYAGQPDFDYVFALACLDTGHVTEGVFALERVLAVDPNHPQARAELARAYLLLGELDAARKEFEAVKRSSVPKAVEPLIDSYLAEIDRRQGRMTRVRGYLSFTVGYDNNVSSANDSFAGFTNPRTQQRIGEGDARSDMFGQVTGGASIFHRLGRQIALIANAVVTQRWNQSERRFDTGNGYGELGIVWQRGQNFFTVSAQGSRFLLNRDRYRDALGVSGQWRHVQDASTSFTSYVQATALTFGDEQWPDNQLHNANRYVLGGAVKRELGGRFETTVTLGPYGGTERVRASGFEGYGYNFFGVNASAEFKFQPQLTGFVNAAVEWRNYAGPDPSYELIEGRRLERDDTFLRVGGGLSYEFAKQWNLIPRAYYSHNSSNGEAFDYDRVLLSMTLRRNFE